MLRIRIYLALAIFLSTSLWSGCSSDLKGEVVSTPLQEPKQPVEDVRVVVVKKYMLAVAEDREKDAESLMLSRRERYAHQSAETLKKIDSNTKFEASNEIPWFKLLRDRNFILGETFILESGDESAVLQANCTVPERRAPEVPQAVVFELVKFNGEWRIWKIDLTFENMKELRKTSV